MRSKRIRLALANPFTHQDIGFTETIGVRHQTRDDNTRFLVKDEGMVSRMDSFYILGVQVMNDHLPVFLK